MLRAPKGLTLRERVEYIGFNKSDCWEWRGWVNGNGYGVIRHGKKSYRIHRLMWEWANDMAIPVGLQVMHSCDNRMCGNPDHLSVGTASDNMRDAHAKGRAITGGKPKLSPEQVFKIRRLWETGDFATKTSLDKHLGLPKNTTCRVTTGRAFGWLGEDFLAQTATAR